MPTALFAQNRADTTGYPYAYSLDLERRLQLVPDDVLSPEEKKQIVTDAAHRDTVAKYARENGLVGQETAIEIMLLEARRERELNGQPFVNPAAGLCLVG